MVSYRVGRLKRAATIAAAGALAISVAGCGGSGGGGSSSKVLKVAYGSDYVAMTPELAKEWWDNMVKQFEKSHPGIKVELEPIPGGYTDLVTKLNLLYRDPSTAPDVAQLPNELLGDWVSSKSLMALNDYVAKADWWQHFPKSVQDQTIIDGKVYAVNQGENTIGLWYNKPMFEKAGLPVPWQPRTWQDVIDAAEKIKASGTSAWPLYLIGGTAAGTSGFQYSAGTLFEGSATPEAQDPSSKKWIVDSPGIRQVLDFYKQIAEKGLGAPESIALDANSVYNLFKQMADQKMAIAINGNWLGTAWTKKICAPCWPDASKVMGATSMPTVDGTGSPNVASTLGGWDLAIGSGAKNPDLAWEFIEQAQERDNSVTAALYNAFIPPDSRLGTDKRFVDFAPPYQAYFASALPGASSLSSNSGYAQWASGFGQATGAIIQNPSMSVDQAVKVMSDFVVGQLGSDKVTTVQ